MPKKLTGMEAYHEYDLIRKRVSFFVSENNYWPSSLAEAQYLGKEQQVNFDLTEPWTLLGKVNNKVLNKELIGRQIKFSLNPQTHTWVCNVTDTDIPKFYLPINCGGSTHTFGSFSLKTWSMLTAITALIVIILLAVFRHPLLKLVRNNDFSLDKIKYIDLNKLDFLSRITGHRKPLLKSNGLTLSEWQQITSTQNSKPSSIFKTLSQILPVESIKTEGKFCCRFILSDQFELNLPALLVVVSEEARSNRIISQMNQMEGQSTAVLLWLNNSETHKDVRLQSGRINRPCLIPSQQEMTRLLVFDTARDTLIKLASSQLPINTISPYQGKGGIVKSSHFFGRKAMLDKLEAQMNSSFILVGGRQLGKTSLLKAYYRKLKHNTSCFCLYISLSDEKLLPRLSHYSGIECYTDLADLIAQLQSKYYGKTIHILIDEADLFVQSEIEGGFQLMNQIRDSAQYKQCQFVFAGFWQLYATAVLDYHSPLRNLTETITIGPLNSSAASQLIDRPMVMLNRKYENSELILDIYQKTGGRANLINIICEHLVEQLASGKKIINSQMVEKAYKSNRVIDAMLGWSNLTADPHACALDRVIVYLIFINHKINLLVINQKIEELAIDLNPEQLKQSVQRLTLAHVLVKKNDCYQFAVPLFSMLHDHNDAQTLIKQEARNIKS